MALLETVFRISRKGQIASLRVDAVMREQHGRVATTTNSIIEDGAVISDHVTLSPITISMDGFISDAPVEFLGLRGLGDKIRNVRNALLPSRFSNTDDVPNGESRSPLDAWEYLNEVWKNRDLIAVVSSLQVYRNMVLTGLTATKTPQVGKSLEFNATLTQVTLAKTETADVTVAKDPQTKNKAAAKNKTGKKTGTTATGAAGQKATSLLKRIVEGITGGN